LCLNKLDTLDIKSLLSFNISGERGIGFTPLILKIKPLYISSEASPFSPREVRKEVPRRDVAAV
jgi:hypothetical protein